MRTKTKLTLAALGFVAATTAVVIGQSTPPHLATVGRRVPFTLHSSQIEQFLWPSPQELLVVQRDTLRLLQLERGTEQQVAWKKYESSGNYRRYTGSFATSPDGKWLTFVEQIEQKPKKSVQRHLVLMHPDGSGRRQVASLDDKSDLRMLWQPDSQGFLFYWESEKRPEYGRTFYALDESIPPRVERTRDHNAFVASLPITFQVDGRLLVDRQRRLTVALCDPQQTDSCEELSFALPADREKAEVETFLVSHDNRAVVSLRVAAANIPERGTWEELLHRKLPVAYQELWVLSAKGERPRCVVREAITEEQEIAFGIYSLSPDGKNVLVHVPQGDYYLIPLH
ncbi:hypothetical protein [Armatimonas rosea]|uniref:Dipeptidyl aminopeptidase/acylaminoacyl peptidase n=1 Tax=Armatimonas rosea TaxID=685828 RepID=A0A7W9SPS7_ARMRO|nr:hypothetical protein [Armatimonas rosea]MBB6049959.1 dipeptidyl aminopeptidase/acylaminoacyl peptidase [Armatimonas rosea]